MEIKNLLLKALVVSAIGCFGSIGMYYQMKLSYENKQKEITYKQAYECYEKLFYKFYYEQIINKREMGKALEEAYIAMQQDGFKNFEIWRAAMSASNRVKELQKSP